MKRKLRRWQLMAIIAVLVLVIAIVVASPFLLNFNKPNSNQAVGPQGQDGNGSFLLPPPTQKATSQDLEDLKQIIGVESLNVTEANGTDLRPPTDDQWNKSKDNMTIIDTTKLEPKVVMPSKLDLSAQPYFPPVGNQGPEGSCTAWATDYYAYGYLLARYNNWTDVSAGNSAHLMSPAWTFNKVAYGYSTGSSFIGNYQSIQSYGAASMSVMPYSVSDFPSWGPSTAWREAFTHPSINYTLLLTTDNSSTAAVQNLVWHGTPVNFAMHDDVLRTAAVYGGKKAVIASSDYTFTGGYHAQTIVGYDNDTMLGNETGAFKVVNSWGTNFGQKGFYWITYACMNKILQAERYAYYISDIHERNTSLMASMHFDAPPATRYGSALDVGVVSNHVTESESYSLGYIDNRLPSYMCLDVSNLVWDPKATANNCTLTFHDLAGDGSIASAHIEGYDRGYSIGGPDELSEQPSGLPASTGAPLTVNLAKYPPQTVDNILNISGSQFSTGGFEHWLSIPDGPNGTYAVRSGDLVDSQDSWLSAAVTGPAQLQFQWKVSSQPGHDLLTFSVDGTTVNTTSGENGWTNVTYSLASGLHQLQWRYAKDAATLQGGDCGWLSSLGPPASSANDTTPPNTNNNTNNATPPEANNSTNETPPPEPPPPTNGTTEGNNTTMAAIGLGARVGRAAPSSIGVLELRTAERR